MAEQQGTRGDRPAFVVDPAGTAAWSPRPGDLVTDTSRDRIGKAVGWDGAEVIIAPLDGGAAWNTGTYRPANDHERLRARVILLNREHGRSGLRGWDR
ncbi:hypothetical protein AB0K09_07205 [Streptomyces sp. NPDC049577]|uniref:hypothetical protein n=1 Tax=Streptomyces sp. NPDC049577 TaxID=3155153 RepID=UPI003420D1B6